MHSQDRRHLFETPRFLSYGVHATAHYQWGLSRATNLPIKMNYSKRPRFFLCHLIWVLSVPLQSAETATMAPSLPSRLIFLFSLMAGIRISPILARGAGGGGVDHHTKARKPAGKNTMVFFPFFVPYECTLFCIDSKGSRTIDCLVLC